MFRWCRSLERVTLSRGITEIGDEAFYACTSLKISITRSITKISGNAFYGCDNLTVQYDGTKAQWKASDRAKPYVTVHCTDGDITE